MGINQDRMLALIAVGEDYRKVGEQLCENIQILVRLNDSGRLTPADIEVLRGLTSPVALLREPINSPALLRAEADHFRLRAGRNARQKRYMAKRRANGGPVGASTEDEAAQIEELTSGTPKKKASATVKKSTRYDRYNMHDDGDPENFAAPGAQHFPTRDLAEPVVPNRRPFTGPDFEPQAEPATKESHGGNE